MKSSDHLPLYGVGPVYGAVVAVSTVAAVVCSRLPVFAGGYLRGLRIPLLVLGIAAVLAAAFLWYQAVIVSRLDDNIVENRLVTTGAFAWVRNPIYSAIMMACTGVLMMLANWYFAPLPFLWWLFVTVLMKNTEERWLRERFGQEYEAYCRRVNRCWPRPPRR